MAKWLGWRTKKTREGDDDPYTIEDLIVLGRYEEARSELTHRMRTNPRDYHSAVKLGDVYRAEGDLLKAGRTYVQAAEGYAGDGFLEKALALMLRVQKEIPADPRVAGAVRRLENTRQVESHRETVVEALSGAARKADGLNRVVAQNAWPAIASSGLPVGLSAPDVRRLFLAFRPVVEAPATVLVRQGEEREALFLVLHGSVEAEVATADGRRLVLETYGPSALFGERSLLAHLPWLATYSTRARTTLLLLEPEQLPGALQGSPNPKALLDALRSQERDQELHGGEDGS
ncbi:MAG: cyclic nucleotide-binding domain-containing protein [Thermoanaerobaculia bacterium]